MRILLTGASGFIGRALLPELRARGFEIVAPGRAEVGDLSAKTDWRRFLDGARTVVHLAGVAHTHFGERALMRANAEGTRALAAQAAQAGVERFVLMSSVKAAAESSGERALTEADAPTPTMPYGRSKLEAEEAVLAFAGLRPIALRPPVVHAPAPKINFALLLRLAASPLPLPFADTDNRLSLIARESLVSATMAVLTRPEGATGAFFVTDRPSLSTGAMIAALRRGLGRGPGLMDGRMLASLAPSVLRENLEVDDTAFRTAYSFEGQDSSAALEDMARTWNTRSG